VLQRLLESIDLPSDGANIVAARQLLSKGTPITRNNVQQLTRTLAKLEANAEDDFEAAAYLQANRLPITAATLELTKAMLRDPRALGRQIYSLRTAIGILANVLDPTDVENGMFDETQRLVEHVAEQLSERILIAGESGRSRFVEGLKKLFKDQGTSLEGRIAHILAGRADATDLEDDLRALLSQLVESARAMSDESSGAELRRAADLLRATASELADGLQAQQLMNAAEPDSGSERWLSFQLPFAEGMDDRPRTAELRIASEPGVGIDPNRLRLVFRLELERLKTVEVGIQIAGKRLVCSLASDCAYTLPLLHREFYSLRHALEELGYFVTAPSIKQIDGCDLDKGRDVPNELARIDLRV